MKYGNHANTYVGEIEVAGVQFAPGPIPVGEAKLP